MLLLTGNHSPHEEILSVLSQGLYNPIQPIRKLYIVIVWYNLRITSVIYQFVEAGVSYFWHRGPILVLSCAAASLTAEQEEVPL